MAIKGKSKGRSARTVTRGPKPVYQPVKRPLLAQRGFWTVVGVIFGVALIVGLVLAWVTHRNATKQDALEQRLRTAMTSYQGELEPILSSVGQPLPPSNFQAFADLSSTVKSLEDETPTSPVDPKAAEASASTAIDSARSAVDALEAFDVTALIRDKGFSEEFVLYAINARDNLARAMRLYLQTAELVKLAARAQGHERTALVARARGVLDVADETFSRGYSDYVQAQTTAGVFQPTPLTGLPTGS